MVVVQADVEQQLPFVRRGYDPYEVQRLVGHLANEMRALTAANEELRARVASIENQTRPRFEPPTGPTLDDARRHAADLVAGAEREGNAIRQRARIDADRIVELAQQRAREIHEQSAVARDQLRSLQGQITHLLQLLDEHTP